MGIDIEQYRARIGCYNRIKYSRCSLNLKVCGVTSLLITVICLLILLLSGDVELNPGPPYVKLKSLSACHVNIRSLNESKMNAITTELAPFYDIITLSETFLSQSSPEFSLNGYHPIIRKDRDSFGGGVAVFVKDNIFFQRKCNFETQDLEAIWLELHTTEGKLLLCTLYRPPNNGMFWEKIEDVLDIVTTASTAKSIVMLGDLNSDFKTADGRKMIDFTVKYNLTCHVNEPTRITDTTATCLDQIISNIPNYVKSITVSPPVSTNDHHTVGIQLKINIKQEEPYYRQIWLYNKGDYGGFRNALGNHDWESCFHSDNIEVIWKKWLDYFLTIAKEFIPNKIALIRPKDKEWYSNDLRKMKRRVYRSYLKAKRTMLIQHWNTYKSNQKDYQTAINEAKSRFQEKLNLSLRENRHSKLWWKTVKKMLGKGCEDSYPPIEDINNNNNNIPLVTNSEKAEAFNDFFLSHNNLDTSSAVLPDANLDEIPCLENIQATEKEICELIQILDRNKATGPDGLSPSLIKEAGHTIVPSLTKLINLSLLTGKMPSQWKCANVIPIHKKGSKSVLNNYRPISLLPIISKIMERVVFKSVYNFFHDSKFLSSHQSGFRPKDSTVNQLSFLYHEFCKALDEKKDVRVVFCDISKAFDKVWHEGIIYKLHCSGIRGRLLNWFKDYLKNRKQRVVIKGQCSDWGIIKAGVPQGSVLGPLLFLVYINDLADEVDCNIKMFADDTTLYIDVDDPESSANKLNSDLSKIKIWADLWLVDFNPSKTKAMTITNRKVPHPPLRFANKALEEVKVHKHLGVTFSHNLSWSTHVDNLYKTASKSLNILHKLMHKLDRKTLETIYLTFIRPKLEYASPVWSDLSIQDKTKLENCQIKAAQIVTGAKRRTSHTNLYNEVSWPKLEERRRFNNLNLMHKITHTHEPEYLFELLPTTVNSSTSYNLRNKDNFKQHQCKTEKYKNSFFPSTIKIWNALTDSIKNEDNNDRFKRELYPLNSTNMLFYCGNRKSNIIHAQIRMNCSNLNNDLFNMHVLDSPKCLCSHNVENAHHFFFDCPLYNIERLQMTNVVGQITDLTLHTLLHGNINLDFDRNCIVFEAVQNFIVKSGRF